MSEDRTRSTYEKARDTFEMLPIPAALDCARWDRRPWVAYPARIAAFALRAAIGILVALALLNLREP